MSKVVRVKDGNYKIVVDNPGHADGGLITLDTTGGYTTDRGKVVVTGDLEVKGTTTTVESTDTTIADNIIVLNNGQSGSGISASLQYQSGIEIDRGSLPNARVLFDESVPYVSGGSSGSGSFTFENSAGQLLPVSFNSLNSLGDLYITTPTGAINVAGTVDYETNVFTYVGANIVDGGSGVVRNNDYIPNAKGVVDYITYALSTNFQDQISEDDTSVVTDDFSVTGTESTVKVTVDGIISAGFFTNRVELAGLQVIENEIQTLDSLGKDLILSANSTGTVRINDTLQINETPGDNDPALDPAAPDEGIKLYSKVQGTGSTGLFYVNRSNTQDENISKNKALVFSMIF